MTWRMYVLQNYYHSKFSQHPSLHSYKKNFFSCAFCFLMGLIKRSLIFNILRILELRLHKSKQISDLEVWEFISAERTSIPCNHFMVMRRPDTVSLASPCKRIKWISFCFITEVGLGNIFQNDKGRGKVSDKGDLGFWKPILQRSLSRSCLPFNFASLKEAGTACKAHSVSLEYLWTEYKLSILRK